MAGQDISAAYGSPVTTVADLDQLDEAEMVEGYRDGYRGDPEPQGNRSRSYWHGWRNGAVDGKHRDLDPAQMVLVRAVLSKDREA